jgi:hypothetical protein
MPCKIFLRLYFFEESNQKHPASLLDRLYLTNAVMQTPLSNFCPIPREDQNFGLRSKCASENDGFGQGLFFAAPFHQDLMKIHPKTEGTDFGVMQRAFWQSH